MMLSSNFLRVLLVLIVMMAFSTELIRTSTAAGGDSEPTIVVKADERLSRLSQHLHWLPSTLVGREGSARKLYTDDDVDDMKSIVVNASKLPPSFATDAKFSATRRGLAALAFSLSDSPEHVLIAASLFDNKQVTGIKLIPNATRMYGTDPEAEKIVPLTIGDLTREGFKCRFGLTTSLFELPFDDAKAAQDYLKVVINRPEIPSEWVFRFRRAIAWKTDVNKVKTELDKLGRNKWLPMSAVYVYVPHVYSQKEIAQALQGGDKESIRAYLEGIAPQAGLTLLDGPNKEQQLDTREVVLEIAPQALQISDALWLRKAAKQGDVMRWRFLIAAARLDPTQGVPWLKEAVTVEEGGDVRSRMLETLWLIGGKEQLGFIADQFFSAAKDGSSVASMQDAFVSRLATTEGNKALPVLECLILDKRFTTLGWTATRAFAMQAWLFTGKQTPEIRRYLDVQHHMGISEFEEHPELRAKYLVDTKHVLMQTDAFQLYLQSLVSKQGNKNEKNSPK